MRSRGFAIRPQSVTGKANAPGARMSPGGAAVCQKTFEASFFTPKHPDFRVIARPQHGRGNLKAEGMASRGEAREHETGRNSYHKRHGFAASFCFLAL